MSFWQFRLAALAIGYVLGNILTAEIVSRKIKNRSAFEIGSGNPGMANIMAQCGFKAGMAVLAGDLLKTFLACGICRFLLPQLPGGDALPGVMAAAYAGLGAVLGHNFPVWHRFSGGKGVSCTCAALFAIHPLWGTAAMLVGMIIVFITKYLPFGGVAIPAVFIPFMYKLGGREGAILMGVMTLIMFIRHFPAMMNIPSGKEASIDVPALIAKKLGKK